MPADPHNLQRSVEAQDNGQPEPYATALAELRAGHKRTHWIWYVFPQLRGLGRSERARHYGISSLAEAQAYHNHPILGPRYRECVSALQPLTADTVEDCFGATDTLKLRSSLTLFIAAGDGYLLEEALGRLFHGEADRKTLELLEA